MTTTNLHLLFLLMLCWVLCLCRCAVASSSSSAAASDADNQECHANHHDTTLDDNSGAFAGGGEDRDVNDGSCRGKIVHEEEAQEAQKGSSSSSSHYYCGLYLAESSIPHSGWGLFAGARGYRVDDRFPHDVGILIITTPEVERTATYVNNTRFKLFDYAWGAHDTCNNFEDNGMGSRTMLVLPGLGSLTNSHTGLFNVKKVVQIEQVERRPIRRSNSTAGAFSHCQRDHFHAIQDIAPGQEIFTSYGDQWFAQRFPNLPRTTDYDMVDALLSTWKQAVLNVDTTTSNGDDDDDDEDFRRLLSSDLAAQLWHAIVVASAPRNKTNKRVQAILPKTRQEAIAGAMHPTGVAGATTNHFRSMEWLQQHGMCVDHLHLQPSQHVPYQNGAFVKRPFQKGERVTPVPVVPISRKHLLMNEGEQVQLLLNYCYGHPESSLLLVPIAPVVNLINHAGCRSRGGGKNHPDTVAAGAQTANVALRWSPLNNNTHFQQSVLDILTQPTTQILMELYAVRDLKEGEEVLLDYGSSFEIAWQRHHHEWQLSPPTHSQDYVPPQDFTQQHPEEYEFPPSNIQPRCWIDVDRAKRRGMDAEGWYPFVADKQWHPLVEPSSIRIGWTMPCDIIGVSSNEPPTTTTTTRLEERYLVFVYSMDEKREQVPVKDVPWSAITFVDKSYQGHQFLRQAFRHEIHLPNELFPEAWKDLPMVPRNMCKLYMAETNIPNSTRMGVYTTQPINAGERIHFDDIVLPVVDYQEHQRLRHLYQQQQGKNEEQTTEQSSWFLNPLSTRIRQLSLEANDVLSIIPGLGMMGNSQAAGAPNNAKPLLKLTQSTSLHREHDPGAGASSYFHGAYSIATKLLRVGEVVFFGGMENIGDGNGANHRLAETVVPTETMTKTHQVTPRVRTIEWLKANGRCLDNIRPGDSTILQAGKGAFATRWMSQGTVIAPMPLVPIARVDLELYESVVENHQQHNVSEPGSQVIRPRGKQLLINYCYGHPSSSLLLFPYSPVVNYVNHHSSPNAKLQWSTSLSNNHQSTGREWLDRSPVELLAEKPHEVILMELVALRDIQPNEEVFIDYGDAWREKWQEFERTWHPPEKDARNYRPAWLLNKRMGWIRTKEEEQEMDPYPFNNNITVFTACYVGRNSTQLVRPKPLVDDDSDEHELPMYQWTYYDGIYQDADYLLPCDILERTIIGDDDDDDDDDDADIKQVMDRQETIAPYQVHYKVRVQQHQHHDKNKGAAAAAATTASSIIYLNNVPRKAIRFVDKAYSSDLFIQHAFRHEIQLPEDMVPWKWRDLA